MNYDKARAHSAAGGRFHIPGSALTWKPLAWQMSRGNSPTDYRCKRVVMACTVNPDCTEEVYVADLEFA